MTMDRNTPSNFRVWGSTTLWLIIGALILWAQFVSFKEEALATSTKTMNATNFSRCQAVGIIINTMAAQRDKGYSREKMLIGFEENDILDRNLYGLMVDMVYDHPEKNPDAIEKSILAGC